jgi:16S rRNA (guanine527-N7)-methyltransferase
VPAPTRVAREVFGSRLQQAQEYAEILAGAGVERGLIGPAEAERIWDRHLLNSAVVAELLPEAGPGPGRAGAYGSSGGPGGIHLADLGSGAGLPGLVLAILRPDARVTLVEPMSRRTAFLTECVAKLQLGNVEICRGRAEELAGQIRADVVTARAVAQLDRLAELAAGLCVPGGLVLAIKGASAQAELDRARPVLRRIGATDIEIVIAGTGLVAQPTTVVRFRIGPNAGAGSERSRRGGREPRT